MNKITEKGIFHGSNQGLKIPFYQLSSSLWNCISNHQYKNEILSLKLCIVEISVDKEVQKDHQVVPSISQQSRANWQVHIDIIAPNSARLRNHLKIFKYFEEYPENENTFP